jgi:hypothetical protein
LFCKLHASNKREKETSLKSITDILNKKLGYVPLWGHCTSFSGFHSLSKNITIKTYGNIEYAKIILYVTKIFLEIKIYLKN